jgi:2-methylcitrate dehydratase PrpD
MDCALKLKHKYNPAPQNIREVVCRTAAGPVPRLWEPLADKQRPVSGYGAKFSLPYSIAVMLVYGRAGLGEFTDEAVQDPAVLNLAVKVRYVLDPTIDYPRHFSGHVKIFLNDGTLLEENQLYPRGGYEEPLPPEEIAEKFRANARLALPVTTVGALLDSVRRLEQLSSIATLSELLGPS